MSTIHLEAVPGRMLPVPGKRAAFYGYARIKPNAKDAPTPAHAVPGGHGYVIGPAFQAPARSDGVPADAYLRRAVLRGDLRIASSLDAAPKPRRASSGEEKSQ